MYLESDDFTLPRTILRKRCRSFSIFCPTAGALGGGERGSATGIVSHSAGGGKARRKRPADPGRSLGPKLGSRPRTEPPGHAGREVSPTGAGKDGGALSRAFSRLW